MRSKQLFLGFCLVSGFFGANAQNIDPTLTAAIIGANVIESDHYNSIKEKQDAIQLAQTTTIAIVEQVNEIQNKIYSGLMQVSSALKNAYQIKEALECLNDIISYQADMLEEGKNNPLALALAVKVEEEIVTRSIAYYAEIQDIVLKANTKDLLMDAGERSRLLYKILLDLKVLRGLSAYAYNKVHLAVMQGVINSINPFRGYVDIDKQIVDDLLRTWKH